jgi:two-component system chemotaxis response regulator CheY
MKKILIVDDLMTFVEREKGLLNRSDVKIFTATSGEEALRIHRNERVDLIIADLDMPVLAGDKLCSLIRNSPDLKDVSVLIVCTSRPSDIERVSACKANDYIAKPIRPVQLLERVSRLLDIQERKNYRVLLQVKVNGEQTLEPFFCSSRNISASGLLIETDKELSRRDSVTCSFFLPKAARIVTDAEVVRSIKRPDGGYEYGVRFVNIEERYRATIEEFVKNRRDRS